MYHELPLPLVGAKFSAGLVHCFPLLLVGRVYDIVEKTYGQGGKILNNPSRPKFTHLFK
jgi:hypothetical protein